jgi:hypothetical protein
VSLCTRFSSQEKIFSNFLFTLPSQVDISPHKKGGVCLNLLLSSEYTCYINVLFLHWFDWEYVLNLAKGIRKYYFFSSTNSIF